MSSIGFSLSVGAFILALFNQFELMPYAESIAHLSDEPYRGLWENAVAICHNVGLVVIVLGSLALALTAFYVFKTKNKSAIYGSLFAIASLLIGYFQFNGHF